MTDQINSDSIDKALSEIEIADWEDGPGKPVEWGMGVRRAATILREVKRQAGVTWVEAAISATPDGEVHFSWLVGRNRATLTIPNESTLVVGVRKFSPAPSYRTLLTDTEAVAFVLPAFYPARVEAAYTEPNKDEQ